MTDRPPPPPDPDDAPPGHNPHHIIDQPELAPQKYDSTGFANISTHMGIEWRWNLRARRVEWRSLTADDAIWTETTDRRHAWFKDRCRRFYTTVNSRGIQPYRPAGTEYDIMLGAHLHDHETDPFLDWLENLPPWDRTDRAETLISRLFDIDHDPIIRWASKYPLLAAVERTYRPGAKIREHPVLFGPQNIGKSSMYEHLLPSRARHDWFGDSLELDGTNVEKAETLAGRVIVEVSELAGYRRADIERLKAFLARSNDGQVRMKYAHNAEASPRRCAIVMTANPELARLPNDPSGLTRFVAVNVEHAPRAVEPVIDAERDQLWAETVHKHRSGEWPTARLPRNLTVDQETRNAPFRDADDAFEDRVAMLRSDHPATLGDIAAAIDVNPLTQGRRLQIALRNHGWVQNPQQKRIDGRRVRLWHPPTGQPDSHQAKYEVGQTPLHMQARNSAHDDPDMDF